MIGATGILSFVGGGALINVWLERRIIGRIQVRRGPNRVGPFGLFQPVADAIKLIQKEVLQPTAADAKLFNLPPILVFIPAMLTFAVFAWAPDMVYADLNVGVLYLLALSSITSLAIFMAGWSSNNKYALLGAMRVIAMSISYEIPLVTALLAPVLFAGHDVDTGPRGLPEGAPRLAGLLAAATDVHLRHRSHGGVEPDTLPTSLKPNPRSLPASTPSTPV